MYESYFVHIDDFRRFCAVRRDSKKPREPSGSWGFLLSYYNTIRLRDGPGRHPSTTENFFELAQILTPLRQRAEGPANGASAAE